MAEIAGLKLIVPSSVAGTGVSLSGAKVTFTSASTISVNGCFTSTYDNYLIVVRSYLASGNNNFDTRLRASGSDASGSDYAYQYLLADGSSVSATRNTSQNEVRTGYTSSTQRSGNHLYVYGPALAQPTAFRNVGVAGTSSGRILDFAGTHSLSTAYDGFSFLMGASSITGTLCVYGLSQ